MSEKKEDKNIVANPAGTGLLTDVRKAGILRKLKTMKKKYFVLRSESDSGPARLEYYDNEKKFKSGVCAKRSIPIKTCFNINRKIDAKHKLAIALYTKDDCFSVVADSENSQDEWLNAMLELQLDSPCMNGGAKLKPKFEHVWQVTVGDKSLASSRNMKGLYRLCLTPSALALVKVDQSDTPETLEFPLMSIRRCGHTNNYFVIELGRSSITGAGELWLETEDVVIAQNMHEVTLNAMKTCREHEDLGPLARPRSASNSENSRPIATRRPVAVVSPQTISYGGIRDRCDSMPSRPRTISEGQEVNNRGYYAPPGGYMLDSLRPHGSFSRTVSYSPPAIQNPLSPVSATCSTDSAGSSLSIDEFDAGQQTDFAHGRYIHSHPTDGALHTEPPIKEEQLDDYVPMTVGSSSSNAEDYLNMAPISSSAPIGVSLHLNASEASHSSSLPPSNQSSDYMEMKSPTEGYINMSPLSASTELCKNRSSSVDIAVTEISQGKDGYIPMAPIRDHYSSSISSTSTTKDGYLDMAPLSSSLPKTFSVITNNTNMSSRKDSHALLPDTPVSTPSSTNLEDFPLDKVKSFFADSEDLGDSYIRPVRAYSMGSRPQPKKKSHLSVQLDGSRIRAYSVGSQSSHKKIADPSEREFSTLVTIDKPRAGTKSSSAPLLNNRPPRVRASTSRGDVGEDLMEIDYNRLNYPSCAIDDSNFTIEPVGRSRSGSYSSPNPITVKLLHDRELVKPHSSGHSCNETQGSSNDYLSMSPVGDKTKSLSRSPASSISSSMPLSNNAYGVTGVTKREDHLHPSGEYVSLDPTSTYHKLEPKLTSISLVKGLTPTPFKNSRSRSPNSLSNVCPVAFKSNAESSKELEQNNSQPSAGRKNDSDYMCMNFSQNTGFVNSTNEAKIPNKVHSSPILSNAANFENDLKDKKPEVAKSSLQSSGRSSPETVSAQSPTSKSPSPQSNSTFYIDIEPKTPPPSPCYNSVTPQLSGAPLVENLVRRLSQPSNSGNVLTDTNSRNCEVRLNYASLDLPPATEDDIKGVCSRLKKSIDNETKEAPLTYAQIDFSPVKKAFQESESLSHL